MTALAQASPPVGVLLRQWRERRRMSQLDLAIRTEVSTRHLSFVETGRSKPTREMLLRLCDQLDIPLRARNTLLLAAGFAPMYSEHDISEMPMAAISAAIGQILDAHMPYPAVVVDRHWSMVDGNEAIAALIDGCAAHLLEPPVNVLRLSLHPDGMAPRIRNLGQWRAHLLDRLGHQVGVTGDEHLADLHRELSEYPGDASPRTPQPGALVVPLVLESGGRVLSFLSTTTVFGTPLDVTVAELAIEAFYPADDMTRDSFAT